jgi:hypothetical protein
MTAEKPTPFEAEQARELLAAYERNGAARPSAEVPAADWLDKIGPYLIGAIAIPAAVALLIFGDAKKASEWLPVLTGAAATVGSIFVYLQGRTIKKDVNSKGDEALALRAAEAYARGKTDTMAQLEEMLDERAAAAVAADRAATATTEAVAEAVTAVVEEAADAAKAPPEGRA